MLDDGAEVRAPIAGVVAGLAAAESGLTVCLPVDCPLVTGAMLRELAEACADAAVAQTGPLPGAYRKSALPIFEERLAAGDIAGCTNYGGAARMLVSPTGLGYWIATTNGAIIPFGDAKKLGFPATVGGPTVALLPAK